MCHRRLFNGEDFDRFSRTQKKPHRGRHMHGMHMKTRTDTHIDAHVHACELTNLNKCGCAHTSMQTFAHTLYLSACFTTLLWLAGGLWPSAVLQRQPVMCQEGEDEEGRNRGKKRKRKRRRG